MGFVSRTQESEDDRVGDAIDSILALSIKRIVNPLLRPQWVYDRTENGKTTRKATDLLHSYSHSLLETRLKEKMSGSLGSTFNSSKHRVFLDRLLDHYLDGQLTKQNRVKKILSDNKIKNQ